MPKPPLALLPRDEVRSENEGLTRWAAAPTRAKLSVKDTSRATELELRLVEEEEEEEEEDEDDEYDRWGGVAMVGWLGGRAGAPEWVGINERLPPAVASTISRDDCTRGTDETEQNCIC